VNPLWLDAALGLTLVWIGWRALAAPDLFKAVVLFIVFGLLLALAWARLGAPDVALAEAAIGAGLTGALMLDALAALRRSAARRREGDSE
jgi:energy-converting hydrogenase B subunit D